MRTSGTGVEPRELGGGNPSRRSLAGSGNGPRPNPPPGRSKTGRKQGRAAPQPCLLEIVRENLENMVVVHYAAGIIANSTVSFAWNLVRGGVWGSG